MSLTDVERLAGARRRPLDLGQGHGRGDVGEVSEALGEVAEHDPLTGTELLGEEPEVVAGAGGPVEDLARRFQAAEAGQRLR